MPVVPVSNGPTVGPSATPTLRAPVDAFGGAARPVDLSGLADQATAIFHAARQRADQVAVVDAGAKVSALETDTLYNPTYGALNTKGKQAQGAIDDATARWQKGVESIQSGLSNDSQRVQFARLADAHWAAINEQVQRHMGDQQAEYDKAAVGAYVSNEQSAAIAAGMADPKRGQEAVDNQRAAITDFGKRNGWSDDEITQHATQAISQTRIGVLERMVNADQDQAATSYLSTHRAEFVGKDLTDAERLTDASSVRGESQRQSDRITLGESAAGQLTAGNIDLTKRPRVQNADGSVSTVRSMSFEENGKEILVPTVSDDGRILTNDEAIKQYHETGKHLGIFATAQAATSYAERLHNAQAQVVQGAGNGVPAGAATTLSDALAQVQQIQDPKVRDATESRVRQFYSDQATSARQQQQQSFERVGQAVEQNGGDIHAVPLTDWLGLSVEQRTAIQHRADEIRNPRVVTNAATYAHLINMASLNDATKQEFMTLDLSDPKYQSALSPEDWRHVVNLQGEVRQAAGRTGATADRKTDSATNAIRRKEETTVLKQSDAASRETATRATLEAQSPGASNFLPPPARVTVPKWMTDSAATNPEYADYLKMHGVKLGQPSAVPTGAPQRGARRVPGGPINLTPSGTP